GRVVQVYRLHILQKFHNYIAQTQLPATEAEQIQVYKQLLTQAYQDFVVSNAQKEQVFKVFRRHEPQEVLIAVDELLRS
ncbi:MAG: nitrogenase-stabilizing/protective protein NifW, partial [Pseudomonadota bacterium]|nr:nitrogenase-stabilizing/protective protein NifW [Pseudomonadota bacterium]